MGDRYVRILAAGGAAVLVAALGVSTALAATTTAWTIQPGGAIQAMSGLFTFTDTTTKQILHCASSAASGTLKSGGGLSGSHAGSLSAVSFAACTGPGGPLFARQPAGLPRRIRFTLKPGGLPWHVNFSSYNATAGVVRGRVGHIHLTLSLASCTAMIDGTGAAADDGQVVFRYANSTGQLKVLTTGSNLHVYDVSGCLGLVNSGDTATLSATYTVTPKQAITSP